MVREKLRRNHRQDRLERVDGPRDLDHFIRKLPHRVVAFVADDDQLSVARLHFLQIRNDLVVDRRMRRDRDHRHVLVDERDRPMLHLTRRISLGMDVRDFLQLQRPFQRDRILNPAAEEEEVL